jgi:hypothetical protein
VAAGRRCESGTPDLDCHPAVGRQSVQGVVEEDVHIGLTCGELAALGSLMSQAACSRQPNSKQRPAASWLEVELLATRFWPAQQIQNQAY